MSHVRFGLWATLVVGSLISTGCSHLRSDCAECSCEAVCEGVHVPQTDGTELSAPPAAPSEESASVHYDGFVIAPAPPAMRGSTASIKDEIKALRADNQRLASEIDALSAEISAQ